MCSMLAVHVWWSIVACCIVRGCIRNVSVSHERGTTKSSGTKGSDVGTGAR